MAVYAVSPGQAGKQPTSDRGPVRRL